MDGQIFWRDDPIARLIQGPSPLSPHVEPYASDLLDHNQRERIRKRGQAWVKDFINFHFGPLANPEHAVPPGAMRGLLHTLALGLGTVPRKNIAPQISSLSDKERARLAQWGIRLAPHDVFVSWLLKPPMIALRGLLHSVCSGHELPVLNGSAAFPAPASLDRQDAASLGYAALAGLWVRVDALDRFTNKAAALSKASPKGFTPPPGLAQSLGITPDAVERLLQALGYGKHPSGFTLTPRKHHRTKPTLNPDSPFAVLKNLNSA